MISRTMRRGGGNNNLEKINPCFYSYLSIYYDIKNSEKRGGDNNLEKINPCLYSYLSIYYDIENSK